MWLVAAFGDGSIYDLAHLNWEVNFNANTNVNGANNIVNPYDVITHGMVKDIVLSATFCR